MGDLLIDTNILVLHVVGSWNQEKIPFHKRTRDFTVADFDLLQSELNHYERIMTTQPVLAEVSNLMGNDFHATIAETFINVGVTLVEVSRPKADIFNWEGFPRLGFADASILANVDERTTVLTDDVALYSQLLYQHNDAINFHHLRKFRS